MHQIKRRQRRLQERVWLLQSAKADELASVREFLNRLVQFLETLKRIRKELRGILHFHLDIRSGGLQRAQAEGESEASHESRPTPPPSSSPKTIATALLESLLQVTSPWVKSTTLDRLLEWFRPRVQVGYIRITWTCGCGKAMYADVKETHDEGAAQLKKELRLAAEAAMDAQQSHIHGPPTSRSPLGSSSSGSSSESSSSKAPQSVSTPGSSFSSPAAAQVTGPSGVSQTTQSQTVEQFLLLCVNGVRLVQLAQIPLVQVQNDQILFQDIRLAYAQNRHAHARTFHQDTPWIIRRAVLLHDKLWLSSQRQAIWVLERLRLGWMVWWIGDSVFYIPKSANFVRFELVPVKMDIAPEILEFPSLPPQEEVSKGNYHYAPCPADVHDPLLRYPYLHVLFEPGNHLNGFWTNRSPKKLREKLQYQEDGSPVIGWGVHITEGPNWYALVALTILFVFMTLMLSMAYALARHDVSSGFTMGSFFLAAETLF